MAKTVLYPGSVVSAAFLNALNNPMFDGVDADGHMAKIADSSLDPNGILSRVSTLTDALKVTGLSSSSVRVSAGAVNLPSGQLLALSTTDLTGLSSGTWFVVVDATGTLRVVPTVLPVCYVLAQIVVGGASVAVTDQRATVIPVRAALTPVFGGTSTQSFGVRSTAGGVEGTTTWVQGTVGSPYSVPTGVLNCYNLTINSDAFWTAPSGILIINASGSVNIAGTLNLTASVNGGNGFSGTLLCPSNLYPQPGAGNGGASGHNVASPAGFPYQVSLFGGGGPVLLPNLG